MGTEKKDGSALPGSPSNAVPSPRFACFGLFRRKEVWTLSWRGWLIGLVLTVLILLAGLWTSYGFLAVEKPVSAEVLVVEGWMPDFALADSWHKFKDGNYRLLLTTGSLCRSGVDLETNDTYAQLATDSLKRMFGRSDKIKPVPAPTVGRDRTYTSALALKEWLHLHEPTVTSVNLVTLGPHARRSRLLFQKAMGSSVQVGILAVQDPDYEPDHWWRYSQGVKEMISEGAAYIYARFLFYP